MLFAGAPRFYARELGRLTTGYVRAGGRVAWLGTSGFTSPVRIVRKQLVARSRQAAASKNLFGERLRPLQGTSDLAVLTDRIQFFRGVGDVFGPFDSLEQSIGLPRAARLLASAGHEADRPSLVVYRSGRGVVVRVGAEGFARAGVQSGDVGRIMRRLWTLLSR
jgi:hypothetical protein